MTEPVTIRELYLVAERIEAKIDKHMEKVEARLDGLERWKAWATGAIAVIAAGVPILIAVLTRA